MGSDGVGNAPHFGEIGKGLTKWSQFSYTLSSVHQHYTSPRRLVGYLCAARGSVYILFLSSLS